MTIVISLLLIIWKFISDPEVSSSIIKFYETKALPEQFDTPNVLDNNISNLSANSTLDNYLYEIRSQQEQTHFRLSQLISELTRMAHLNLFIGIGATFFAASIMWTLLSAKDDFGNIIISAGKVSISGDTRKLTTSQMEQGLPLNNAKGDARNEQNSMNSFIRLLHYFAPRLTLVIFVELFAYFFLKLYRNGFEEIKYFNNELTNLESRNIALDASLMFADSSKTTLEAVILRYASTERNFILDKGQSTIEIERRKLDGATTHSSAEIVEKVLQALVSQVQDKHKNDTKN
jgi:hypothetical protein